LGYKPSWCLTPGGTQLTRNTPTDLPVVSSMQDTSCGCLDGVSKFGKCVQVGPAPRLLAAYVPVRGYDYLQGERIRSSSGRPLLYQTASHHLTQSTKGIFARPVAAPSFQPRYPGVHPMDVPDVRPRSLLASPPSETYHQINNSSIRITPKRPPHQRLNATPPVLYSPEIQNLISCTHKFKPPVAFVSPSLIAL
jgi:hypothetical protein